MSAYTCPTCGETMERDLSLFMDHTDKHIVEEVKKLHPNWITEEGFCPKCADYFKKAMSGEATTNLDAGGIRQRVVLGAAGFGAALAIFFWLRGERAPQAGALYLFPLFFFGALGFWQAKRKLCVVIAQKQTESMRRRASRILFLSLSLAVFLTVVASFLLKRG